MTPSVRGFNDLENSSRFSFAFICSRTSGKITKYKSVLDFYIRRNNKTDGSRGPRNYEYKDMKNLGVRKMVLYKDDDGFAFALGRAVNHGRGAKNRSNLWSSQRRLFLLSCIRPFFRPA